MRLSNALHFGWLSNKKLPLGFERCKRAGQASCAECRRRCGGEVGRRGAASATLQRHSPLFTPHFAALARLPLPCSAEILKQYARHLSDAEVLAVAHATPGMAGRDLKDICEQAERRWASKV